MIILKWVIVFLAIMHFGFMGFDGARGLVKGDYIRPKSGQYAGQLGPWGKVVGFLGIDPESDLMKSIFVLWGVIGLVICLCFAIGFPWAWKGLLIYNILSLWYLGMGTVSSIVQILLLLVLHSIK